MLIEIGYVQSPNLGDQRCHDRLPRIIAHEDSVRISLFARESLRYLPVLGPVEDRAIVL